MPAVVAVEHLLAGAVVIAPIMVGALAVAGHGVPAEDVGVVGGAGAVIAVVVADAHGLALVGRVAVLVAHRLVTVELGVVVAHAVTVAAAAGHLGAVMHGYVGVLD